MKPPTWDVDPRLSDPGACAGTTTQPRHPPRPRQFICVSALAPVCFLSIGCLFQTSLCPYLEPHLSFNSQVSSARKLFLGEVPHRAPRFVFPTGRGLLEGRGFVLYSSLCPCLTLSLGIENLANGCLFALVFTVSSSLPCSLSSSHTSLLVIPSFVFRTRFCRMAMVLSLALGLDYSPITLHMAASPQPSEIALPWLFVPLSLCHRPYCVYKSPQEQDLGGGSCYCLGYCCLFLFCIAV